ncbi:hypothetical protein ACFSTC_37465 [Nonomuraea ferruginea]
MGEIGIFGKHPWILTDGGREIVEQLSRVATGQLGLVSEAIGRTTHTGLDDAFYMPEFSAKTRGIGASCTLVVLGDGVRDFEIQSSVVTFFPYDKAGEVRKNGTA